MFFEEYCTTLFCYYSAIYSSFCGVLALVVRLNPGRPDNIQLDFHLVGGHTFFDVSSFVSNIQIDD